MRRALSLLAVTALVLLALWGCENDTSNQIAGLDDGGPTTTDMTCLGCHSSEEMLRAALGDPQGAEVYTWNKDDG